MSATTSTTRPASRRSACPSFRRMRGRRSCRSPAGCSNGRAGTGCVRELCDAVWRARAEPRRSSGCAPPMGYDRAVTDPLFDLSGRVAVVTGGMGQLGAELVVALAARGMRVAILDRRDRAARRRCRPRTGARRGRRPRTRLRRDRPRGGRGGARARRGRLGRSAPARQRRGDRRPARRARGGGRPVRGRARSSSLERVVHVNVLGVVVPCQVIGGAMARAGRGSIVNVGSVYGLLSPDQGLYDFRRDGGRDVLQARRLLGLEVRARQPHPLPRDLLGPRAASASTR